MIARLASVIPIGSSRRLRRGAHRAVLAAALALMLLASACGSEGGAAPTATAITPIKLLATVFVSPTPDAAQREATRQAQPAASPTPLPTRPAEPTAYVGIFLGAADSGAIFDQDRFAGTLTAPPP